MAVVVMEMNSCLGKGACLKRLDGKFGRPFDSNADRACLLEGFV